jgi:hypothetical protein
MWVLIAAVAILGAAARSESGPADSFDQLKTIVGDWQAELPGFGKLTSSVRLVSNGTAIEETIGTPADNEISVYTRDRDRILLTHFCAMTPGGHQARLESLPLRGATDALTFIFRDATNLPSLAAPHMRRVAIKLVDRDHYTEQWTKTDSAKDTVFELNFVRQSQVGRAP